MYYKEETPLTKTDIPVGWLFLLYNLPARRSSERVSLWRRLRKFGALSMKTSTAVLPDEPVHYERFQWLTKEITDVGGEATLIRVREIEGLSHGAVAELFNEARAADYQELLEQLRGWLAKDKERSWSENKQRELKRLHQRYQDLREIDYFQCPRSQEVFSLLEAAGATSTAARRVDHPLDAARYRGKTWLTRPRPGIDRVSSAWLIRRFIDPDAAFVFARTPAERPDAIGFDMVGAEFTHEDDRCTFETLVLRFGLKDRAVRLLAEMVHDADLEEEKFRRVECVGLDRVFKGWAKTDVSDQEILDRGSHCFEGLYAQLRRF